MRKNILIILSFTLVLLCIIGAANNILAEQNNTSHTESVCEHHYEEDQIYVDNNISCIAESKYIIIESSSTNLLEYSTPIWKPPVNS